MNGRATGGGAIAFATLVLVAPDAGMHVGPLREALDGMAGEAGVSCVRRDARGAHDRTERTGAPRHGHPRHNIDPCRANAAGVDSLRGMHEPDAA